MPLTADGMTAIFPHPVLTPIVGEPGWPALRLMQKELNANAVAIPSNLGCGRYGLLSLTMTPTAYNALTTTPVVEPTNPGVQPEPCLLYTSPSPRD